MAESSKANSKVQEAVTEAIMQAGYVPQIPSAVRTVSIELDKIRNLRMTLGSMKIIQDMTGDNPWATQWEFKDPYKIGVFLWACLKHEDPELTLEQVLEMPGTELSNVMYLVDRLSMLWGYTMPDPVNEDTDPNSPKDQTNQKN